MATSTCYQQQDFILKELNKANSYLPLDGCPGPVSISARTGFAVNCN